MSVSDAGNSTDEQHRAKLSAINALKLILHKNRSLTRIRLEDYEGAEFDCNKALELCKNDAKIYYRRALALEKLDKINSAFKDAKEALSFEPANDSIRALCSRLVKINSERIKQADSLSSRINEMLKLSFDPASQQHRSDDMKIKAMNNLLVLCRESNDGAQGVWQNGEIVEKLLDIVQKEHQWNDDEALCATRILDELSKSRDRALKIIDRLTIPTIARLTHWRSSVANLEASSSVIQHVFNALAGMDRRKDIKPDNECVEANKLLILKLILELEEVITDSQYTAHVREVSIDLLLNLMHMDGGLPRGWSWRFTEDRGLYKMLHVATQIPEQCDYPVSIKTRQHVAIFLAKLYDDMVFDQRRQTFKERCDHVLNGLLTDVSDSKNRIKLAALLITLLQGPVDVGVNLVTNSQVTNTMFQMAQAEDDPIQQKLAVELMVASVSKYECATNVIKNGLPILKRLFHSTNADVRVRALMGLCKCAAAGGDDCSRQPMADGTTLKLAQHCKKILHEVANSVDIRRFACEGLSYLSLDADVKEFIVQDSELLRALVLLAKSVGSICVFTLAAIYLNCSNAYDKPKVDEEMVKLAAFAKHHVPETHPKDAEDFVEHRVKELLKGGAVSACVAISKTESRNALDHLARVMCAFCKQQSFSGQIISEGGVKLLLNLFKECSAEGKLKAAHGLVKLGSHCDPNIAFTGQRMYEVVKPAVQLIHPDIEAIANYEAILTLTNLASVSDSVRLRILKERALPRVEDFWFDPSNEHLCAAAAELLLNMLYCEGYFKDVIKPGTDKAKLWMLYCDEGSDRLKLASSAGFALLSEDRTFCERMIGEIKSWPELLCELAMSENEEVQRRCLIAIANMVESCERVASEIISSKILHVLVAITKYDKCENKREGAITQAVRALEAAKKFDLIKPTDRQIYEEKTGLPTLIE